VKRVVSGIWQWSIWMAEPLNDVLRYEGSKGLSRVARMKEVVEGDSGSVDASLLEMGEGSETLPAMVAIPPVMIACSSLSVMVAMKGCSR
jgi:hypothetical protein